MKTAARKPKAKSQPASVATIPLPALKEGEHWVGIMLNADGSPSHHLILLPGEAERVTWTQAKKWAKKTGGELPTRREQSLLFANLKDQFQPAWYWSSEQPAADAVWAWVQDFTNGNQDTNPKGFNYRARAVRRIKI